MSVSSWEVSSGQRKPRFVEFLLHGGGVVPHIVDQRDGIRLLGSLRFRSHAVALGAMLGGEDLLAAPRVAGLFEEVRGVEVGEQIGGGLFVEIAHAECLRSRMAAHMAGAWFHMVAARVAGVKSRSMCAAQIGTDFAALSVDAVALDAAERLKQLRAADGIHGRGSGVAATTQEARATMIVFIATTSGQRSRVGRGSLHRDT